MYLISLTCVGCESRDVQVIEYRTEKGGLGGKAKMHEVTKRRSNQEDVTAKANKDQKRQLIWTGLSYKTKALMAIFCVICLCFFTLRSMDGSSSMHRPGILGFKDKVSAHS